MSSFNKRRVWSRLALLSAAMIWGSSFFVLKNTIEELPPCFVLALRFTVSSALLLILFHGKLRDFKLSYIWKGGLLGGSLYAGYLLQTYGLMETSPGKNAFLTAIYCVIVPFLFWGVTGAKPGASKIFAAVLCLAGIGTLSLTDGFSISRGDALTLLSGLMYAVYMVMVAVFTKNEDVTLLSAAQFVIAAILFWVTSLGVETIPAVIPAKAWWPLIYLSVFCTAVALMLQNIGQKYTNPGTASILLSLEAVFGVFFSAIFYGEELTPRLLVGFAMVFAAILIAQYEPRLNS